MTNKSVFISLYLTYAFAITIWSIVNLASGYNIFWMLVGMLHLIPLLLIARFYIFSVPRTLNRLPFLTLLNLLLFLGILVGVFGSEIHQNDLFILAATGFSGWLLYVFWYSQLPIHNHNDLSVGATLPEVKLKNLLGRSVENEIFDGDYNVLLFYRGNWCPLCMAQLKEIAQSYQKLENLGTKVFLISPQPSYRTEKLSEKYKVKFNFLVDANALTAKKFRIFHKSGTPLGLELFGYKSDTVLPTVIIVNKSLEIIFIDQTDNYRVRPVPATFMEIIKQSKNRGSSI